MVAVILAVSWHAASVALYVAGARKNAQIADLRQHGVPVEVTITGCQGLLGGSGSNAAGYACRGTFTLDGRRDDEALPGNTLLSPGTKVRAVAVPGDPGPRLDAGDPGRRAHVRARLRPPVGAGRLAVVRWSPH